MINNQQRKKTLSEILGLGENPAFGCRTISDNCYIGLGLYGRVECEYCDQVVLCIGVCSNNPALCRPHGHRRRKGSVVGGHHGECEARAYNGGLAAEPPAGSRGRAPGQGTKPPEAESILVIGCPTEPANLAPLVKFSK